MVQTISGTISLKGRFSGVTSGNAPSPSPTPTPEPPEPSPGPGPSPSPNPPGDAMADWVNRIQATQPDFAYDMANEAWWNGAAHQFDFNWHRYASGLAPAGLARVVQDITDGFCGQCLRIDCPAGGGPENTTSPGLYLPLRGAQLDYLPKADAWKQGYGNNQFFVFIRLKFPASRVLKSSGDAAGWKVLNIAFHDPTNINRCYSNGACEHVVQDTYCRAILQAYHRDSNWSYPPFEQVHPSSSWDVTVQNMVDNGVGKPDAERYCLLSTSGAGYPGCVHWPTDRWFSLQLGIKVGTYGGTQGNVFDMWMADAGATAWRRIIHSENHDVGPHQDAAYGDNWVGGLNGIALHMYETSGRATVNTHGKYGQLMVGRTMFPVPGV